MELNKCNKWFYYKSMFKWLVLKYYILLPKGYELECASSVLDLFCFCSLTWLDVSLQIAAIVIASPQRLLTIKICYYQVLLTAKSKDEFVGKYYPTQQNQIPAQNYAPFNQCLARPFHRTENSIFHPKKWIVFLYVHAFQPSNDMIIKRTFVA